LPFIPKFPPGCAHLDLKEVERVLVRHWANLSEAAKELGVSRTDLRRLTWHSPKLLEEALLW
jgi:ActR/RegA family two-component response regulator